MNKMQRLLTGLVIMVLLGSCGEKIPEGVISPKKMPDVLLDVHLADGQLTSMPIDSARIYRQAYYSAIFDRYGIDSAALIQSIAFYSTRPYLFDELYSVVEKRLQELNMAEQKAMEEEYKARHREDSIRNARRVDSLNRITRDSLDFKRKRYLLYVEVPDTTFAESKAVPVTHERLRRRMMEVLRLADEAEPRHPAPPAIPPSRQPTPTPAPPPKGIKPPTARPSERIK
ncbi:DUF4296 domain-containing protein [Parapedobacter composti]|nr:DUF4296 domain-containing protein [Parapedobacter composti]